MQHGGGTYMRTEDDKKGNGKQQGSISAGAKDHSIGLLCRSGSASPFSTKLSASLCKRCSV